jgi:hypothetical protein
MLRSGSWPVKAARARLKSRAATGDGLVMLTRAVLAALLLAIPLCASWLLVRHAGAAHTENG